MLFLFGFLFGVLAGLLSLIFLAKNNKLPFYDKTLIQTQTKNEMLEKEMSNLKTQNLALQQQQEDIKNQNNRLQTQYEIKNKELEHQKQALEETSKKLKLEFESMAQKIFKDTSKTYQDSSEKSITNLIQPLQKDIVGFKDSIQNFHQRTKFLQETIKGFEDINQHMRDETRSLSQALTGNTAAQGQWGEILLENILEKSGLRKDEEFFIQSEGLGLQNTEGEKLRPDVIVKLPDKKFIVIDSKVSLTHYQNYDTETDEAKKEDCRKKIITSLKNHINELSQKEYSTSVEGFKTPDFVLMFIPVEPVFSFAIQHKQGLFDKAWEKSIVLVSPITLYATLRTIASIWKIEKQNKNAEQIAKESGLLFDKFVGFLEDMKKIEKGIKTANDSYDSAINKLESGRGNLIQKAENIKRLGAKTNKNLPASFQGESS